MTYRVENIALLGCHDGHLALAQGPPRQHFGPLGSEPRARAGVILLPLFLILQAFALERLVAGGQRGVGFGRVAAGFQKTAPSRFHNLRRGFNIVRDC